MEKYCCLCKNEGKPLCYRYCDVHNQGWYEFSWWHWLSFQLWWLWIDIRIWWWLFITDRLDKNWWKNI
jgi:hypothetical protein